MSNQIWSINIAFQANEVQSIFAPRTVLAKEGAGGRMLPAKKLALQMSNVCNCLAVRDVVITSICYYITGPRDTFVQVDMISNYMFRLGLRGTCTDINMTNPF